MDENVSFSQLRDVQLRNVQLEGIIVGSIIESLSPAQVQITLGPHVRDPYTEVADKVIVIYPEKLSRVSMSKLEGAKEIQQHICVRGSYSPDRKGDFLGVIQASDLSFLPYCD